MKKINIRKNIIGKYIENNLAECLKICFTFLFGVVCSIIYINNLEETLKKEIYNFIKEYIIYFNVENIPLAYNLIKIEVLKYIVFISIIYLFGMCFTGNVFLYLLNILLGFYIGSTSCALIGAMGIGNRNAYSFMYTTV